jgi:hypothetical protein
VSDRLLLDLGQRRKYASVWVSSILLAGRMSMHAAPGFFYEGIDGEELLELSVPGR